MQLTDYLLCAILGALTLIFKSVVAILLMDWNIEWFTFPSINDIVQELKLHIMIDILLGSLAGFVGARITQYRRDRKERKDLQRQS